MRRYTYIVANYIGIDIGGTKIAGGIVSARGDVLRRSQVPTDSGDGGAAVLARSIDLAMALIETQRQGSITGIGIGAAGQIDAERGVVAFATEILPGWAGIDIAGAFTEKFGLPVRVDNDVNALASGEYRFGAARGCRSVIFLALGTGVGGALMFDGSIHHGAHWTGGEAGHLLIDMSDAARIDAGGAKGTLEAYASGIGLAQTYVELLGLPSGAVRGEDVVADADANPDGPGAAAIRITGERLGFGLASLANLIDPDLIVIGGGLSSLGDRLLDPARRVMRARALPGPAQCNVVPAALGSAASILGAASLAMEL
jgi:glucokinase